MTRLRLFLFAVLIAAGGAPGPAHADRVDQNRAREAVMKGEIEPLSKALAIVEERFPGSVLKVDLEKEGYGRGFKYEIKVLTDKGRVIEVEMDAKSLEILEIEGEDDD